MDAHNWFIDDGEKTAKGPFPLSEVKRMFDQGKIAGHTRVCPEGTIDWRPVASLLALPDKRRTPRPWLGISRLLVSTLGLVAFGLFLYRADQAYAETRYRLGSLEDELVRIRGPGRFVPVIQVTHQCFAIRDSLKCTFTNLEAEAIFTCIEGRLQNEGVPALRLSSQPLCSGKLSPGETRTVTSPWIDGFADDICNKETAYGKTLDWTKCDFTTLGLDVTSPTQKAP